MTTPFRILSCITLSALALLTGCGITGDTTADRVTLNPSLGVATLNRTVLIGTVIARPGAGVNQPIDANDWGKFDADDVATLRATLARSIPPKPAPSTHTVHVVVAHFGLSYTNNRVAGLGIFDWCVTDGTKILASERFYATYDSGEKLIGTTTLGRAKDRMLHAAAKRIAERSLAVANARPRPPAPPLTFDDPASAKASMPTHMKAGDSPSVEADAIGPTTLGGLDTPTRLLPEPMPPPTDWPALLAKLANGNAQNNSP